MLWMAIAALAAYFVKGLCGFANTLVFSTILSFHMNNVNISPVELLLGYPTNLIMAWRNRRSIEWKISLPLAGLVLLGNIPGIILLKNVNTQNIKIVFGIVIAALGLEMLLRTDRTEEKGSRAGVVIIGVLSGILCGLFGIGALLAACVGRITGNSGAFKANICTIFVIENTFRIVLYSLTGITTPGMVWKAAALLPFMLLGLAAGMKSSSVLNEGIVRRLMTVMLILSGAALVINNI